MDGLADARRAHSEQNWPRAYQLLTQHEAELTSDDLSALADAAWWLGKLDDSIAARERAFNARSDEGDLSGAALEAFYLSLALGDKGADAQAAGWRSRSSRLAAEDPGSRASGYLLSMEATGAFHAGRSEECVEKARATIAIGESCGDPTLVAWATHVEGLGLVKAGEIEAGWAKLDESMVAATTTRLTPMWTGLMYCGMLVACEEFGDPKKGWQWVEATERWLGTVPGAVLYPGVCRVHKVRIMQMRGIWPDAEAEARRACEDLVGVHVFTAARGFYELGELKRLTGDLDAAQDFYKKAHQLGWDPQPGLARLRLAQGRPHAAVAGIRRAVGEVQDPLIRATLLPHQIDVCLAAGEPDLASEAAGELTALADRYGSPAMIATAAAGRGAVLVSDGDPQGALTPLRLAVSTWMQLDCIYEVATARVTLATALRAVGDEDGATLELEAARDIFDTIGARPDLLRVKALLEGKQEVGGLSPREIEVLRLVAAGHSNRQVAAELVISENTVARHIQNIFVKLGVGSRTAAISAATKLGLTE